MKKAKIGRPKTYKDPVGLNVQVEREIREMAHLKANKAGKDTGPWLSELIDEA